MAREAFCRFTHPPFGYIVSLSRCARNSRFAIDTSVVENFPLQELPSTIARIVHGRAFGSRSSGGVQSENRQVLYMFIVPKRVGVKWDLTASGGRTW